VIQHPATALEVARLRLARLAVDEKQSLERVFARATRLIARTLDVERVGIWLFDERREQLCCACLYERSTDTHGTGVWLELADLPRYRAALEEHRAIVAHDARTDPRTSELAARYLEPIGITSMLDAALFRHGEVAGVVCHEHVGPPRRWTEAEVAFVESVADIVAHAMEQAAHIEARKALDELTRRTELDRRMASLGRVAAAVAHDFNNLLMVVQVRAEQIMALGDVPPVASQYARTILDTVRHSREMTRQLAELGRGPEEPAEPAVLDHVVGGAGDLLRAMARDGQEVILTLAAGGTRVLVDRASLERVLTNLVANALDASRAGDRVTVETATVNGADRTYAVVRVTDQGHGIDEHTRPMIFEPYFTTRQQAGGCGLGLAIVHVTAQRAGGFIDVDSEPGRGTTVTVHLPVVG
jgi:two-component system cell cycle sensor histidine kinase/response regulator CckA